MASTTVPIGWQSSLQILAVPLAIGGAAKSRSWTPSDEAFCRNPLVEGPAGTSSSSCEAAWARIKGMIVRNVIDFIIFFF